MRDGLAVTGDAVVEFYASPNEPEPIVTIRSSRSGRPQSHSCPVHLQPVGVYTALYFVDASARPKPRTVKTGLRRIAAEDISTDRRAVFVGGKPDGVEVYYSETGALRVRYDFGLGDVQAIAVAPDGLTFAVAGDKGLAVFDLDG